jgi:hypothetical protein|nr:MAG TPA: hypothetical protein [Caudoviricetes sp.]
MRKDCQAEINKKVDEVCYEIYNLCRYEDASEWKRLRSCSAYVCKLGRFYILKSYTTIVAAIDTENDICYDFLRKVYGYTATSSQHIIKFNKDYGRGKWGCAEQLTWREV